MLKYKFFHLNLFLFGKLLYYTAKNQERKFSMYIGSLKVSLNLQDCHSLKEKRQIIRSVIEKLKHQYNIAISETNHQDLWQLAELGIVTVNSSAQFNGQLLEKIMNYILIQQGNFQVISHHINNYQVKILKHRNYNMIQKKIKKVFITLCAFSFLTHAVADDKKLSQDPRLENS